MASRSSRTPRPELAALLQAARSQPDDDTARLVLADWLEENGDGSDLARAELIRVQLELSRLGQDSLRRRVLQAREKALLEEHGPAWRGPLQSSRNGCHFERGLLHLEVGVARLVGREGSALAASEALCWLERLTVKSVDEDSVVSLAASPVLPLVGALVMASGQLGVRAARALAGAAALAHLHTLDLNYNSMGTAGTRALADSLHLARLATLDIWINHIGPRGGEALAQSPFLRNLRALNVGGNSLGPRGVAALADSPVLAGLETLFIWDNGLGSAGARSLAGSKQLTHLHTLYLNENRLGAKEMEGLARAGLLSRLRTLSVWGNNLGPRGAEVLATAGLEEMTKLLLSDNRIGDEGAAALAGATMKKLTHLDLHGNGISDAGARALLESPGLPGLVELNLRDNPLTDVVREQIRQRFPATAED
jgi:uncharacterized protein (TIGR02996 family)